MRAPPQFRLNSPELCAKCHTDEKIMSKYGISTQVLNTYVSDFHGTTVTLFEKQSPDQQTNKPVCFDCHGVHNIAKVDDPTKGLQIKTNMLNACQKCHPDANINFPDSWLSHYIPSPEKAPLVYYVNLFYSLFIPTVLGGMAIVVVTDVYRKARTRRKPVQSESREELSSRRNRAERRAGSEGGKAMSEQKRFLRFGIARRIEHLVLILSFTTLAVTGLVQKYAMVGVSDFIIKLLGGIETTRVIHHTAAAIFMVEAVYHLIVLGYKLYIQRAQASMMPGFKDVRDVIQAVAFNLGLTKDPPKMGRYNFV